MAVIANLTRLTRLLVGDPRFFLHQAQKRARQRALLDYRLRRDGYALPPVLLSFEVTHTCNLRCYMCDLYGTAAHPDTIRAQVEKPEEVMSEDEDRRLFAEIARFRPTISLTGGEPLLVPRGLRLVKLAKEHALAVSVTTNGTLLSRAAEALVDAGVDSVTVSIDGRADLHDSIRGVPGTFERACEGVTRLNRLKRGRGGSRPHIEINATICGRNCGRISEMIEVAQDLGVERLQFSHLWYWHPEHVRLHNRLYGHIAPCTVQNIAALEGLDAGILRGEVGRVRAYKGRLPIKFIPDIDGDEIHAYYSDPLAAVRKKRCVAPWLNARVMPNGDLIPCLDLKAGNVRENTFGAVWNGDKLREFRRLVKSKGVLPGCLRCCKLFSY